MVHMDFRRTYHILSISVFILVFSFAITPVSAWNGSAFPPFDYEWKYNGGILGTFSASKTTGYIQLEHDQAWGSSWAIVIIGERVTTPNYGDSWNIEFRITYRCYYEAGGLFFGTYSLWTTLRISDANHNTVIDSYEDLAIENWYSGSSYATREPTYWSRVSLEPNTDYYLELVVEWDFNGWIWMHEYPGSGFNVARFDVTGIYWTFIVD